MSKSILVIDTPASCSRCKLRYDSYGQCEVCIVVDDVVDQFYETNTKPEWCPLPLAPERKDLTKYTICSTGSGVERAIRYAYDHGYNDCLYDLNGGNL